VGISNKNILNSLLPQDIFKNLDNLIIYYKSYIQNIDQESFAYRFLIFGNN
jgi:hypothetical protein